MSPHQPAVSVIIPCKGHATELRACLSGLQRTRTTVAFEIIVVDSNTDNNVMRVIQDFDNVRLLRSKANLKAGLARNLGVTAARGHLIAFIDADCIPSRRWLEAACRELTAGARMVGGPVVDALPDNPIAVTDNMLQFAALGVGRPRCNVDVLPACNLAVSRTVFETAGGFPDERYIEDSLFALAVARRWPGACWFVPDMRVAHQGRTHIAGVYWHQYWFGYARGRHGFKVTPAQQKLSRHFLALPLVALKRLAFVYQQTLAWNRQHFFQRVALFPLILVGLAGWVKGFRNGCNVSKRRKQF